MVERSPGCLRGNSPDSKLLAYTRSHSAGSPSIETSALQEPARHTLVAHEKLGSGLQWLPDGRLIYTLQKERPNRRDSNAWAIRIDKHQKSRWGTGTADT